MFPFEGHVLASRYLTKPASAFWGSDFNLFVELCEVFKHQTYTLGGRRVSGKLLSIKRGLSSSIARLALGPAVSAWPRSLSSTVGRLSQPLCGEGKSACG